MYQETVRFDKEIYNPGDDIRAEITLVGPFEDNLRKVEINMGGYIKTRTTSTDSDGDTQYHHEEVIIFEIEEIIEDPVPAHFIELQGKIPISCPISVVYEENNKIEYVLHIKYDLAWAQDHHSEYQIPLQVERNNPDAQEIDIEIEGLGCKVPTNIIESNRPFALEITSLPEIDFRSFRIEFCQEVWMEAHSVTDTDLNTDTLYEISVPPSALITVDIPEYNLPVLDTETFKIRYYIKLVIDIAFSHDINLEIPVFPK